MPRRDGTGPLGMGPMTGRGFGNCSSFGQQCIAYGIPLITGTIAAFLLGRSFGKGYGRGLARRNNGLFSSNKI